MCTAGAKAAAWTAAGFDFFFFSIDIKTTPALNPQWAGDLLILFGKVMGVLTFSLGIPFKSNNNIRIQFYISNIC